LTAGIGGEMMMPQRLPMMTRLVGKNSWICMSGHPAAVAADPGRRADGIASRRAGAAGCAGAIAGCCRRAWRPTLLRVALHDDSPLFVATWYTLSTCAGHGDRRAGRIEAAESTSPSRRRRVLLHAVEAQHLLRGRRPQPLVGVLAGRDIGRLPPDSSSRMLMIVLTVDHESPATFARIITPSARVSIIMFSAIATGTLASAAIDALASSNLPASANDATWNSSSRPSSYSDLISAWAIRCFW
jgi:hypothetical protein